MTYRFEFKLSYMGIVEYRVFGHPEIRTIETRDRAENYELSLANGEDVRRDMLTTVGAVYRCAGSYNPLPRDLVDAFNSWKQEKHSAAVAQLRAQPEKYGFIDDLDPIMQPPVIYRAMHFVLGSGFVDTYPKKNAA